MSPNGSEHWLKYFMQLAEGLTEVHGLDRSDIDYQAMSTNVIGKGNKEREVYLSFKAMYHLKKYLMSRLDEAPALFITERQPYRRLSNRGNSEGYCSNSKEVGDTEEDPPTHISAYFLPH